jgi:hypothetical protein
MARTAGPLTVAIRQLCEKHDGSITHAEARPLLKSMGFDVVPEAPEKSAELTKWESVAASYKRKPDPENPAAVKVFNDNIASKCGFSAATTKSVLNEIEMRSAFEAEANNFNVTKYNWNKMRPTPSRRPANSKADVNATPAKIVAKSAPARRGRPRTKVADTSDVLSQVKSLGGLSAVATKITDLTNQVNAAQAEIARLQTLQTAFADLQQQLAAAA